MKIKLFLLLTFIGLLASGRLTAAERFVAAGETKGFQWIVQDRACPILADSAEFKGIIRALINLQVDASKVTGVKPDMHHEIQSDKYIIIGSINKNRWIKKMMEQGLIDASSLIGKQEKYIIQTVKSPLKGIEEAVVIAGSDMRGTIYGIYELSSQMGVSPWYYWADVPVEKKESISILPGIYTDGEPAVEYRGIFLNDEAPALSGWAYTTFGGFNSKFYEKVFELVLRLKGNFMWPAMWGNAFYDDDPMNGPLADEMGIIMGTSHHEPMGLAQQDWKRRGKGAWNYQTNADALNQFWQQGMERCKDWESVITVGMRGDGDEPMSEKSNISLLTRIVKNQRKIISKVTGKKETETPQVWALYKEVQDYYDNGMRVPDDITLLLCDDNWGNVRKLPSLTEKPRKGGYGMYYHFDYVGAPRNSKWLNITQIQRVWEQMNLSYKYGVRKLWIVNVGDLKPMEYPITFFLDMAWNPGKFNETNLQQHTIDFCAQQFGKPYAEEAARIINRYTQYNRRVTPEFLDEQTYSLHHYEEWQQVKDAYKELNLDALRLYHLLPIEYRDAFDQLVLYPVQACANLYEMYHAVAMNHELAAQNNPKANEWAKKAQQCYERDSTLSYHYNYIMSNGKWKHMMDQIHIGYTYWQQPEKQKMPEVTYVAPKRTDYVFAERDGYISIEAEHYTRHSNGKESRWIVIPGMGRTLSGVTTAPCTKQPDENSYLEYDFYTIQAKEAQITIRLSPTLNFNTKGLRYAISIDGGEEQTVNFNGHYKGELGKWQKEHIIDCKHTYKFEKPGNHTLRFRVLDSGIVLQKIMIDLGGLKPSYLGAPESELKQMFRPHISKSEDSFVTN